MKRNCPPISSAAILLAFSAGCAPVLLLFSSGCASSPWKRSAPPLYSAGGVVLYREHKEVDGVRVPLGYVHPIDLPLEKAVLVLSQLAYREDFLLKRSRNRYVFRPEEIQKAAEPLSLALKEIGPDQRLRFLFMHSSWTEVVIGTNATSGVLFSPEAGTIHAAFDRINERIHVPEGGEVMDIAFADEPTELVDASPLLPSEGTRLHVAPGGAGVFPRWLEVRVAEVKRMAPPQAEPPPLVATPVAVPERPALDGSPRPAVSGRPSTGSTPASTESVPPATPQDPAAEEHYRKVRERLETLKRLRSDGALSEEEYQKEYQKAIAEL